MSADATSLPSPSTDGVDSEPVQRAPTAGASGRWVLHQGDALAVLRSMPDASVDAVITDPPYSSGGFTRGDRSLPPAMKYTMNGTKIRAAGVLGRQPRPAVVRVLVRDVAGRVPSRREARRAGVRLHRLAAAADDDGRNPGRGVGLARDRRLGQDRGVPAGDGSVRCAVRVRRVGDGGAEQGRRGGRVPLGRDPGAGANHGQASRDGEADGGDATAREDLPAGRRSLDPSPEAARRGSPPCSRVIASSGSR